MNIKNFLILHLSFILLIYGYYNHTCQSNIERKQSLLNLGQNQKFLGKGGFGQVHGNGEYAVKEILQQPTQDRIQLMKNEIQMLVIFGKQFDFAGLIDEGCYVNQQQNEIQLILKQNQMKETIKHYIKKQFFDQLATYQQCKNIQQNLYKFHWMIKIGIAINKMHLKNIIHRDIKLENIFMLNEFQPVIGDLGLAITLEDFQTSNLKAGTSFYQGYKVFYNLQKQTKTQTVDIYALMVLFVEILKGRVQVGFMPKGYIYRGKDKYFLLMNEIFQKNLQEDYPEKRENLTQIITQLLKIMRLIYQDNKECMLQFLQSENSYIQQYPVYKIQEEAMFMNVQDFVTPKFQEELSDYLNKLSQLYIRDDIDDDLISKMVIELSSPNNIDTNFLKEELIIYENDSNLNIQEHVQFDHLYNQEIQEKQESNHAMDIEDDFQESSNEEMSFEEKFQENSSDQMDFEYVHQNQQQQNEIPQQHNNYNIVDDNNKMNLIEQNQQQNKNQKINKIKQQISMIEMKLYRNQELIEKMTKQMRNYQLNQFKKYKNALTKMKYQRLKKNREILKQEKYDLKDYLQQLENDQYFYRI